MIAPTKARPIVVTVFYESTGYSIVVPSADDGDQHLQRVLAACASKFKIDPHFVKGLRRCSNGEIHKVNPTAFCHGDQFQLLLHAWVQSIGDAVVETSPSVPTPTDRRKGNGACGNMSKRKPASKEFHDAIAPLDNSGYLEEGFATVEASVLAHVADFEKSTVEMKNSKKQLARRRRRGVSEQDEGARDFFEPACESSAWYDSRENVESSESSHDTDDVVEAKDEVICRRGRGRGRALTGRGTTGSSPEIPWILRARALELMKEAKDRDIYVPPLDDEEEDGAGPKMKNANFRDSCRGNTKNIKSRQRSRMEHILRREIAHLEQLLGHAC